jgi:hypothetical protein
METIDVNRESLAYNEKIYLAKLEAKKAEERVSELEYEFARWQLEIHLAIQKQRQQTQSNMEVK